MTDRKLKWGPAVSATLVAVVLIGVSCEAPRPEPLAPGTSAKSSPAAVSATDVFFEYQVEKPVTRAAESVSPMYPKILREAGVEGEVLVSFVVDESGQADVSTLRVMGSTHALFTNAVREALPKMRFVAAEVGGKKVRQLVQQPFTFALPGTKLAASRERLTATPLDASGLPGKTLAFTVRRQDVAALEPNVVVYSIDGTEIARSERGANLLPLIEPKSIHSIEVFKPRSCPTGMTCPLIKITLVRGKTLGIPASNRLNRDGTVPNDGSASERPDARRRPTLSEILASPMNVELLNSRGEVVARYGSRPAPGTINSEDISASEVYTGSSCKADDRCPLTRIWLKPGREAAYRKQ